MRQKEQVPASRDGQPIALAAHGTRRGRGVLPRMPKNETIGADRHRNPGNVGL